jgi:hexokinase
MHPKRLAVTDYQHIKQNFLRELLQASKGLPSSLTFIQNPLAQKPLVTNGIVQAIVIGGTNYILQTLQIEPSGTKTIFTKQTGILPTFTTKQDLIEFLTMHLDDRADAIGVNFGFPLDPCVGSFGELDGKLIHGTKEHTFTGLTEPIGSIIKTLSNKPIKVSVANDTICLLLSGNGSENGSLIAGTGINAGIKMMTGQQTIAINLEIGNFNKFAPSDVLLNIDRDSEKPGEQLFEKATSGKYLAHYFNEKAKELSLNIPQLSTSQELSALSLGQEQNEASELAKALLERSASLFATALAAIYEFSDKPQPFTFIGEGSMLWKGWHYKENIQKQLAAFGIPKDAIVIKHVQDSSINGAIGLVT